MIPLYLLCKMLGLLNTFWIYVLPGMYNVYDMKNQFFRGNTIRFMIVAFLA